MKRSQKNIIMIIIIIIMIGAMYLTINKSGTDSNRPSAPPDIKENNGDVIAPSYKPDNNETPPEKPDGDFNIINSNENKSINTETYILLGIESLITLSIIVYLFTSEFNKKTFKETYNDKKKIIINILVIIILSGGLTYLCTLFIDENKTINGPQGGMPTNQNSNVTYSANKEITSDENITSGSYSSNTKDENVISVNNSNSNLSNIEITKTGDSDGGDNTSFYGTNSAILAKNGAIINISNATITTDATGANGVFSYGGSATTNNSSSDNTTVNISDSKITTSKDNSGGIMTTGGGIMNASNLTITTAGTSSAAIRSDRGGGVVNVNKGTYKTTGKGSPAIYSTADITVKEATLIATSSEGIVIEGKNSVTLENVILTDTNNTLNGQSTTYKNIFLYQSMSGDAADGKAIFTSKDSTITTNKGDSFYVTNTTAEINLENNIIVNNDSTGNFLRIQKDSWGKSGNNGGVVTLNMTNQKVNGDISVDNISTLSMNMISSNYEGTINSDNNAKSITIKLDSSSSIKLTGDSYITSLEDEDSSYNNIDFNGYKLYINGVELKK